MGTCLRCINSACCKLVIEVSKNEYYSIDESVRNEMITYTDEFIQNFPEFIDKRKEIDSNYDKLYAYLPKGNDGLCRLLDRKTMLCSVYDNRPKVCADYELNRCEKIRLCTD